MFRGWPADVEWWRAEVTRAELADFKYCDYPSWNALTEGSRLVNEAEGYRNELVALSRGNAKARVANASGYRTGRVNRASGDSLRFDQQQTSYRLAPGPTETRLYLETMEQVLPGKKKLIVDSAGAGRRHLLLLEDGVELNPLALRPPSEPRP